MVFQTIKESVSITRVLTAYGVKFRHKKAFCPFHSDNKHPSLTVSETKKMFNCHTCNVGGDSIIFVRRLFGLSALDAAKKINSDFCLNIDLKPPTIKDKQNMKNMIQEREQRKCEYEKQIDEALRQYKVYKIMIENLNPYSKAWCYAVDRIDEAEYTYDTLIGGERDFESRRAVAG